jgi:23S rRNA pseudouridine2604 synthase
MDHSISLNKFISDTGYCSRRKADELIKEGRVLLNDQTAQPGNRYMPGDVVEVDGSLVTVAKNEKKVYIAFNKPLGITTTSEEHIAGNIISYINFPKRIFPIGRLDKDSEGLIFLTNDGDIVNKLLRAGNAHEKEYSVRVHKPLEPGFAEKMSSSMPILDTHTIPAKVYVTGRQSFKLILTQGLNRQIRRMCEYLGYTVLGLQRIRIMNVKLDKLAPGKWRYLSEPEINALKESIQESSGTAPKTRKGKSAVITKQAKKSIPADRQASAYRSTSDKNTGKSAHRGDSRPGNKDKRDPSRASVRSSTKSSSGPSSKSPNSKTGISKSGVSKFGEAKSGSKPSRSKPPGLKSSGSATGSSSANARPARKGRPKPAKPVAEKKPIGKYKAFRNKGRTAK